MQQFLRAGMVLALAGLALVARKRPPGLDRAQIDSARAALVELAAWQTRLMQDKERLLGRQLHNVDPLAEDVRGLAAARERLEPLRQASWLDAGERATVAGKLDECQVALRAQEASVEALKTYNAYQRNSADNFPQFADALAKSTPRELSEEVKRLHLMVAEFRGEHRANGADIVAAADKLRQAAKAQKPAVAEELLWLAGHAQAVVEADVQLARHAAALEQPEAQRAIALLDATIDRTAQSAAARSVRARTLLLAASGAAGALGLALMIGGLRKRPRA